MNGASTPDQGAPSNEEIKENAQQNDDFVHVANHQKQQHQNGHIPKATHDISGKYSSDEKENAKPYHEKQEWEMCLIHSLNALFGFKKYSIKDMDRICQQLAPDKIINPHKSIWQTGNYDANVLMMALEENGVDAQWFDSRKARSELTLKDSFLCPKGYSEFLGFIVNNTHKKMIVFNRRHWLTIKRIDGVWFNIDSKAKGPKPYGSDEHLEQWLVAACNDDAQLMICRRRSAPEKKAYSGALQMASALNANEQKQKAPKQKFNV